MLIRLQEQPFRVLVMLAERPGEIVTREELQEQIWGNTFVDFDQSLNKAVNRIREALNDSAGTPQYAETIHGEDTDYRAGGRGPCNGSARSGRIRNTPEIPARPRSAASPSPIFIIAGLAMAAACPDRHRGHRSLEAAPKNHPTGSQAYHLVWVAAHSFSRRQVAGLRFERRP